MRQFCVFGIGWFSSNRRRFFGREVRHVFERHGARESHGEVGGFDFEPSRSQSRTRHFFGVCQNGFSQSRHGRLLVDEFGNQVAHRNGVVDVELLRFDKLCNDCRFLGSKREQFGFGQGHIAIGGARGLPTARVDGQSMRRQRFELGRQTRHLRRNSRRRDEYRRIVAIGINRR